MDDRPKPLEFPYVTENNIPLLDEDWDQMDFDTHPIGGMHELAAQMDQEI
jgi:hypothetical protein